MFVEQNPLAKNTDLEGGPRDLEVLQNGDLLVGTFSGSKNKLLKRTIFRQVFPRAS